MTKEERDKALKAAREQIGKAYNSAMPDNDRVKDGLLDCAGLVRYSIMQNSTINDPFGGKNGNGVTRIMGSSRPIDVQDIKEGDLVVMASNGKNNGHVGFVTNIVRDENGKVLSYTLLHSEGAWENNGFSGGGDVNDKSVVTIGKETGYGRAKYKHRYYQWDTPEEDKGKDEKKNNNTMSWGQALRLIASWLLRNPSIVTNF
jgi:NlpC/P60 family